MPPLAMHHVQVKMFIALRRRCHTFTVFAFPVFPLTPFGEKKQHKGTPDLPQLLKNKGRNYASFWHNNRYFYDRRGRRGGNKNEWLVKEIIKKTVAVTPTPRVDFWTMG